MSGDGVSNNQKNVEIKISLGSKKGFNFVQLRPSHNIHYYLFLDYNVYKEPLGELTWVFCEAKYIYDLVKDYGGYSHGTTSQQGNIKLQNVLNPDYEYSLRPAYNSDLWSKLQKFEKPIDEIFNILNT